jgi:hypothetical protein
VKTLAVIIPRDATREPRLIEGDAVCSNSLGDLYSIELREDNVTLKKYDEYGNLILNKHLKIQLPNGFEGVDCSPTTDGGVVFNIRGAQESLIIMQYVLNIVDRAASSSHIVLGYLNEKPFIVVETSEYIELTLISSEVLKEDLEALNKIRDALSEYTDKEVKYNILTTSVTKTETPAWLYSVPRIH